MLTSVGAILILVSASIIIKGYTMKFVKTIAVITVTGLMVTLSVSNCPAQDWLRFRGNDGSGISTESKATATEFSAEKNLAWKIELPGAGASSPIIVGDKVILTCYSGYGLDRRKPGDIDKLKRHIVCYNKNTGENIWQKDFANEVKEDPFQGMGVPEHGYSSSTPVSDGKHVFVFFGKTGVKALDLDGNEIWQKSVGTSSGRMRWGSGASPVLHDDVLVINASDENSKLVGLNKTTGDQVWKADDIENVWSTPVVSGEKDEAVLIFSLPAEVWGINPKNGKLKWCSTNGVADRSVSTSPVVSNNVVYAMGGRSSTAVAIKLGGKSDVTKSHTVWEGRSTGRIVSPIVVGDHIYGFDRGIANCITTNTRESVFKERLPADDEKSGGGARRGPSSDYCSPVSADGKIYQFAKTGTCYVIDAKPEFNVLAVNSLSDGSEFNSTPAISEGKIYVRSNKFLYCIAIAE